jgi:hypothetical protein
VSPTQRVPFRSLPSIGVDWKSAAPDGPEA